MLSDEGRKAVVESLLDNLQSISDMSYIKRVWIEARGPEIDDYEETVNDYYSDVRDILSDWSYFGLTKDQYDSLCRFHAKFDAFIDNNHDPEFFIETPEWEEIMELAKTVLVAFEPKK